MRIRKDDDEIDEALKSYAEISDALSHPARIKILKYVAEKSSVRNDVCNRDLVNILNYAQATVSQHSKKLVKAGLFITEKQDKFTIYHVNRDKLNDYIQFLDSL